MNWSKITTIIIIMLLAVNIFLAFNLIMRYQSDYIIDENQIDMMVSLYQKNGITLDKKIISGKRIDSEMHIGSYSDDEYYKLAASVFTSAEAETDYNIYMTVDGIQLDMKNTDESLNFATGDYFSITYSNNSDGIFSQYKNIVNDNSEDEKRLSQLENILNSRYFSTDKYFSFSVLSSVQKDGFLICKWQQNYRSSEIYGMSGYAVFDGDVPVYLSGNLILQSNIMKTQKADGCDQINVLLNELATHTYDSENETDTHEGREVSELSYCYCVNWNSKFDEFYLVPAWKITYSDQSGNVWNVLTESIYAKY